MFNKEKTIVKEEIMIKLEHANLVVADIDPSIQFILAAFPHWNIRQSGTSKWYGKPRKWAHVGSGETYLTFNDNGEGAPRKLKGHAQGLAHLGFTVSNVDEVIENLAKHGFAPSIALEEQDHRRNVYYVDPAGLEFEFVEYKSDDPALRNASPEL
jgi:catechol 2,3-dioxygenase-like lactoylglutathione lyase family enzyme